MTRFARREGDRKGVAAPRARWQKRSRPGDAELHSLRLIFGAVTLLILTMFCAAPAEAQAVRTWVSGVGDDANPCSRTAPCKTFAGALLKTSAAGEINCLDPGGFGGLTITKSLVINCENVLASVQSSIPSGILIAAGPTDVVTLKGFELEGNGLGVDAIDFNSGGTLRLDDVEIRDFTGNGIKVSNSASTSVFISNSKVSDCGASAIALLATGANTLFASVSKVDLTGNATGLLVNGSASSGTLRVTLSDSVAAGNSAAGVSAIGGSGLLRVLIDRSAIVNNKVGLLATNANGEILASNSTITGNTTGLSVVSSGKLLSYGNNNLAANVTANGAFTETVAPQ